MQHFYLINKTLLMKNKPKRGGCQQPGRAAVIVHIGHGVDGVGHLVVHDGVDKHCHRVLSQNLEQDIFILIRKFYASIKERRKMCEGKAGIESEFCLIFQD